MQHKYLLRFIKEEMLKQKIAFKNNEAFFRLFLSDEPWESYRSNMSNWLSASSKDGVIHKHTFITAINEKLGLSPEVWGASDEKQKHEVVQGVARFKASLEQESVLSLWADEKGLSEEQEAFIAFAKEASIDEIEEKVEGMQHCFAKSSQKQAFLLALFELMYEKGAYGFVYTQIFSYLLDTYDNSIKAKKAHIYASLPTPMYREAFDILSSIKGESKLETMDLQTSAISNIRRERLSSDTLSKEALKGLLQTLIASYTKIYTPKEPYAYYPAVNLTYMLGLAEHIFPNDFDALAQGYSIKQIYTDVTHSLAKAKTSPNKEEQYYAHMSDVEFQLLLKRKGMVQEVEYLLETLTPSQHLIDQTSRQMRAFYLDIIERFDGVVPTAFEEVLEVMKAYSQSRNSHG
jgi:hypothetical protein